MNKQLRIANIGVRSIPFRAGSAGGDKVASEYLKRLVKRGYRAIAYNRVYSNKEEEKLSSYCGIDLIYLKTVNTAGFDTLFHAAKAAFHIIYCNTADVVIIGNSGSSIWGLFLRLFGKKVIVWVDGIDWKRDKWFWYAKLYLYISQFITATIPNAVIFDNVFAREIYKRKFRNSKRFEFIKNGVDVTDFQENINILETLGLSPGEYILFVGRFIPDKGLHYLIPAYGQVKTQKKLVLVGGSPNPSEYERNLLKFQDPRILMPGYIYGNDVYTLIKNAYLYIQPSDVEGLSPIIQEVMAIGTPLLCSDIQENLYITNETTLTFKKSDVEDLKNKIVYSLNNQEHIKELSCKAKNHIVKEFSWDSATNKLIEIIER